MKVTIDGILSTAIDLKNKKNIQDESVKKDGNKIKSDSIQIRNRLASRLGAIQIELKDLQNSLTKGQIIKDGINQVIQGFINNDNIESIIDKVTFENKNILSEFLGNDISYEKILNSNEQNNKLIEKDINNLKELQVEIENIAASTIIDSNIEKRMSNIETSLSGIDYSAIGNISDLSPEMVIELIR